MWRYILFTFISVYLLQYASGYDELQLCGNHTQRARSCTTQILGENHINYDKCKVEYYPSNSAICKAMNFGPIATNAQIGGVILKPYILQIEHHDNATSFVVNRTVLNITFTNIKWRTMKFRFQFSKQKVRNHCRNIVIDNDVTINDQSVLYYDCYWSITDGNYNGQSHTFDFEATDENGLVNRGQYYFNIPSAQMLSPTVTEREWKPFIYIEILTGTMKLHILPPPSQLKVTAYKIEVMKECDKSTQCEEIVKNTTIKLKNNTEVTYEYSFVRSSGSFYFVVTPLHEKCKGGEDECQMVESPRITISNDVHQSLNICIASITALIVATLFAYYIVLRVIRRYWCKDYSLALGNEIPTPSKVLVIYSPENRLHAECVASFVNYLRSEYGFDMMYDGDISSTTHGDPFIWANEAFRVATHIMYIVGPAEETNYYNNIYDRPIISPHRDVDKLLLSLVRTNRVSKCPKDVINVLFEHSNGQLPIETRHDKVFFLLKDWHKLISFLSKNLLPKVQITRTEKGKMFFEDLTRAKKLLSTDIKEKKVLL